MCSRAVLSKCFRRVLHAPIYGSAFVDMLVEWLMAQYGNGRVALPGRITGYSLLATSIVRVVPGVRKAVRWNSPWCGIEGQGWFVSYHVFARYVKVTFLNGVSLRPEPPGSGKDPDSRWIDVFEGRLDEAQMEIWVRQAASLPGWHGFDAL